MVNPKAAYKYQLRLKPWITAQSRNDIAMKALDHLDHVVRVQTDSISLDKDVEFNDPNYAKESKTTGFSADLAQDADIAALNTKTLYQTTGVNESGILTRFTSQITDSNGVSDKIVLDPVGDSYIQGNLQVQDLECNDITGNGDLYIPDNGQILGNVTLGTQKASNNITIGSAVNFSSVNINGLDVNLKGFPLSTQFTPSGFFSQI